ncbi:unnamed protein product [Ostreobium quekettii]|uniref:Serine protease n=1 Tax=Ostreobium quekettii TaxID=121088 RepID=A0A8S1J0T4_9CHLO|nr:unnamed protein product [Ostreobium quekettii]|eukprot:evm.model.scf_6.2 EVM.evm.TU.scf_6.2   scf_6:23217-28057(+)
MAARGYECGAGSKAGGERSSWPMGGGEEMRDAWLARAGALRDEAGGSAVTILADGTMCVRRGRGAPEAGTARSGAGRKGDRRKSAPKDWALRRRLAASRGPGGLLGFDADPGVGEVDAADGVVDPVSAVNGGDGLVNGVGRRRVMQGGGAFGEEPGLPATSRGRVRVPADSSVEEPFAWIGQVGRFCSGALVGPCHYLTAGHCVWDPDGLQVSSGANFNPGRNGEEQRQPLGQFQALQIYPSIKWTLFNNYTSDVAIVHVQGTPGEDAKFFGFGADGLPSDLQLNSAGYPGDEGEGEMWFDFCDAVSGGGFVNHTCEIASGSSGSAMWTYSPDGGERNIVAVVSAILSGLSEGRIARKPVSIYLEGSLLRDMKAVIEDMECVTP